MTLRLGTRGSALALAQSRLVADAITAGAGEPVELVEIVTDGDRSTRPGAPARRRRLRLRAARRAWPPRRSTSRSTPTRTCRPPRPTA